MKSLFALSALLLITVASITTETTTGKDNKFRRIADPIANRYIVVLKDEPIPRASTDVEAVARDLNRVYPGNVDHVYSGVIRGYSVEMAESTARSLSEDESVAYVEEDGVIETQSIQTNATWGIARIDQNLRPSVPDTYYEYSAMGTGVNVYVIDTGVNVVHPDFGGRAIDAANLSRDNTPISQCNGHGTHVAGIIGSATFGVAKATSIYSVRVFPCWGGTATSNVIAGVDWVSRHAISPAVANMSVGGSVSSTLDQAVQNSISRGITYVIAAGNYSSNACNESPARVPDAITVGMTDERDFKVDISNYGPCVDIFAPGSAIHSTGNMPGYPYEHIMSGTSTSSPHVAGAAALYLERNRASTPAQVAAALLSNGTVGVLSEIGDGSPNLFLFSNFLPEQSACSGTTYLGAIATAGSADYQSSSGGFSGRSGIYSGRLEVPSGSNFSLGLEVWKGGRWTTVAASSGGNQVESLTFKGKNGSYRWRVQSVANSGAYSLCSVTP